ncbi:MAG TPA: hypothetical protein VFV58_32490 [Blastocatellia bacterium]|jgi:hypothetical protein|nr:hypothetical protein [Blastocatellia bacterium]
MMKKSFAMIVGLFIWSALLVPAKGQIGSQTRSQTGSQTANEPLTLPALNTMLRREVGRDMTEADLTTRVERFGIAFDPTPDAVSRLRANGAHQNLINAIRRAADKLSASAGKVVANGPQPSDPIIEETRKVVRDYLDELPDFICQEDIQRYFDYEGSGAWEKADTLVYELTYNKKRESYKPINSVGRPVTRALEDVKGAYSTGDFASGLASLFDLETKTVFKPAGKEQLGNRRTLLYDFTVPKESSKLVLKAEGVDPLILGYSGTVWIDVETKKVLRIDQALDDIPRSNPVTHSESSVNYDILKLRGLDVDFLLPTSAEFIIADRRQKHYFRNLIHFKFYRKFETDVKIIDEAPTPPQKPPQ